MVSGSNPSSLTFSSSAFFSTIVSAVFSPSPGYYGFSGF